MQIISIQVGKPKPLTYKDSSVLSAINKSMVIGPVMLKTLNLEGDEQADLRVHGGIDKALYGYGYDAYSDWQKMRPNDVFAFGAFGENLCFENLPEDQIYIGDTYELGQSVVQVSQPRFPCQKLALKFNDPAILKQFMSLGRPGVYFRVLKEGVIDVGDRLKLMSRESSLLSIYELFTMNLSKPIAPPRLKEILQIQGLPEAWRRKLSTLSDAFIK